MEPPHTLSRSGKNLAAQLLGHGLPLAWRGLEPDVAVGGNADSVHDDTHTALVSLGIEVAERHDVGATCGKVAVTVEFEGLCLNGG